MAVDNDKLLSPEDDGRVYFSKRRDQTGYLLLNKWRISTIDRNGVPKVYRAMTSLLG